jgi:type II secretory pathway pseudopilin PulG
MKIRRIGLKFNYNRFPAFSLVELMISLMIVAIVGGVAVTAFFITYGSYRQSDDLVTAAQEIELAMAALRPQFTNIGLGMPDNSQKNGSFNISFTGPNNTHQPIMAYMGDITRDNRDWGGPVTLGNGNAHNDVKVATNFIQDRINNNNDEVFAGRELFYTWAVPTGMRVHRSSEWPGNNDRTWFTSDPSEPVINFMMLNDGDVGRLVDFTHDYGRKIGIVSEDRGANIRSWFLFPSFGIPLLVDEYDFVTNPIDISQNTIRARVSPYSVTNHPFGVSNDLRLGGSIYGLEEVHLVQTACIFSDGKDLIQRIYGNTIRNHTDRVLATNVLGVYFVFNDERKILTMYTIARGNSRSEVSQAYNREYLRSKFPSYVNTNDLVPAADMGYRMLVESMTWRIIN